MRVALFFDGANFFHNLEASAPEVELDYDSLASWLVERVGEPGSTLGGATYYTGIADQPGLERFLSGLERCTGYFVVRQPIVTRSVQCRCCEEEHQVRTEKRVDTRIVADMIRLAYGDAYDRAVLLTGDEDLVPAVDVVHGTGRSVYVATWGELGLSPALRARAFGHVDLLEGLEHFATGRDRGQEIDDDLVMAEIQAGVRYFAARGGHLSRWYFVNRWSASAQEVTPGPPRARSVDRLLAAARLELYEAEVNGRRVAALRERASSPG